MTEKKWVYLFSEIKEVEQYVNKDWDSVRGLLGGKGANLAEMVRIGVPVPPGFTITTVACNAYADADGEMPPGLWEQVLAAMAHLESVTGKRFGVLSRGGRPQHFPGVFPDDGKGAVSLGHAYRCVDSPRAVPLRSALLVEVALPLDHVEGAGLGLAGGAEAGGQFWVGLGVGVQRDAALVHQHVGDDVGLGPVGALIFGLLRLPQFFP